MGRRRKAKSRKPKEKKKIPPPPWLNLPRDVTENILQRLGTVEILENTQKVCTLWRSICKDPSFWRIIRVKNLGNMENRARTEIMCRHAVNRSQGQLEEIHLENFLSRELLLYIAERSSRLRFLQIACCWGLSNDGFREAISRMPQLEEVYLDFLQLNRPQRAVEAIGNSCPLLKSFSWNGLCLGLEYLEFEFKLRPYPTVHSDEVARAVAHSMPNLRHLQLIGNNFTNDGLQAILDHCPLLESLDLRKCHNLDLGGDLGRRCSRQIKFLRRPCDSIKDYDYKSRLQSIKDDFLSSFRIPT